MGRPMHVRCREAIVTVQNGVLEVVKSGNGNNFVEYLAYAATPSWRAAMPLWVISGQSNTSDVRFTRRKRTFADIIALR